MSEVRYKVIGRTTDGEDLIVQISPAFFELIRNGGNPKSSYNSSNSIGLGQMLGEKPRGGYSPRGGSRTSGYQGKPGGGSGSRPPRDRNGGGGNKPREYIRRGWGSEIKL